jgi:hypothetical protein
MNRILFLVFALLIGTVLLFTACDKEPEEVADFLRCSLDGKVWTASSAIQGSVADPLIILNGINQQGDTLRMLIQDQQPGTFPVKNTQNVTILKTAGKTYIPLNSADGYLTISKHNTGNKTIEGTFYLTLDGGQGDWKELTEGSFKVTYQ